MNNEIFIWATVLLIVLYCLYEFIKAFEEADRG